MPDWNHIVREHLAVLCLPPEREIEIVEELALHLEGLCCKNSLATIFVLRLVPSTMGSSATCRSTRRKPCASNQWP